MQTSNVEPSDSLQGVDLYGGTVSAVHQFPDNSGIFPETVSSDNILGVVAGSPAPSKFKMYLQSFIAWAKQNVWLLAAALLIGYMLFCSDNKKKSYRKY
ncbi:hypothetical protein [Pedobacter sp. JCM 36344]|uniref:hypothetical protein n=1 Tax=Pedobacter sp. JCM 36344 TaxID=3374280 RepID=UPI00397AB51D